MSLVLKKVKERKPIGQVLVDKGLLSVHDQDLILKKAEKTQLRVGHILVADGYISDEQLAQSLAEVFELPYLDLTEVTPPPKALAKISYTLAKKYNVVPVSFDNNVLVIASNDPMNGANLSALRQMMGQSFQVCVSPAAQIKTTIEKFYSQSSANKSLDQVAHSYKESASMDELVQGILDRAINLDASDIHIEPMAKSVRIRYRVHGILQEVGELPSDVHLPLLAKLKVFANLDVAERRVSQDGSFHFAASSKNVDIRLSTLPTIKGEKAVIRILDKSLLKPVLEDLGMSSEIANDLKSIITRPSGILLVTGPTGSGKTTTVYSLIELFNQTEKNLVTIEDPVEYRLERVNQVQVHLKAGITFPSALRSMLRQDPDVIVIGEIRDRETAEIAIRAALTGHMVISTLHTNDSVTSLSRLMDMGVEPYLIASSLLGIVSQRLVRTLCPTCKTTAPMSEMERKFIGIDSLAASALVGSAKGCPKCFEQGYRGRKAIFEILKTNTAVKEAITKRKSDAEILEILKSCGFKSMKEDGIAKALAGVTSIEEVLKQTV